MVKEYTTLKIKYVLEFIKTGLHKVLLDRDAASGGEKLLFVQDNDLSKNSAKAKEVLKNIGAEVIRFLARSPD